MKYCSKCGAECVDEDLFCMICGNKFEAVASVPQQAAVPQMQAQPQAEVPQMLAQPQAAVPQMLAQPQAEVPQMPQQPVPQMLPAVRMPQQPVQQMEPAAQMPQQPQQSQEPVPQPQPRQGGVSKIPVKYIGIGAGIIAVIAAAIILIKFLPFGGGGQNAALYIKDGELMYNDLSQKESFKVTSRLADSWDDGTFSSYSSSISGAVSFSADGKYIFYPDKTNGDIYSYPLYYRRLNDADSDPVKIDSGISYYYLCDGSDMVTYLKNGTLYIHNLEEKTKIASDVSQYYASGDGRIFIWRNSEGKLYRKDGDGDNEKLDSSVSQICGVSSDYSSVYYEKDGNLYIKSKSDEKTKIASDIYYTLNYNDEGIFYIIRPEDEEADLSSVIDDDLKASDDLILQQGSPEYPWYGSDEDYALYEKKYAEYNDAVTRNSLRDSMRYYVDGGSSCELRYFDGKDSTCISENFNVNRNKFTFVAGNKPCILFAQKERAESLPKMSVLYERHFSDGQYGYDEFFEDLNNAANGEQSWLLARGKEICTLEFPEDSGIAAISPDGEKVMYISEMDDSSGEGELWIAKLGKDSLSDKEMLADGVIGRKAYFTSDGRAVYYTDIDSDNVGTLNLDGKEVAEDVYAAGPVGYNDGKLFFRTDYNKKNYQGTLTMYDGSKTKTIMDDVFDYMILPDGDVLFIYDYSSRSSTGELYLWDGKEKKIDEDVSALIHY